MQGGDVVAQQYPSFDGGVFSDELPGGRAGARIAVRPEGVLVCTAEGLERTIPLAGAVIEVGGASGRMWFVRTPDRVWTVFSESPLFATGLRAYGGVEIARTVGALVERDRSSRRRGWLILGAASLLVIALGAGFVIGLRGAAGQLLSWVPRSVDQKLGDLASEHMETGRVSGDVLLNQTVKTLVDRLGGAVATDFTFKVRVVESGTVNAYALPGGQIVVYTGLLREAASPEQVAGVLAHEMAHVVRRHGMQRIAQSVGVVAMIQLVFGDVSGVMAIAVELMREGAINSYSRADEHQADMDAVERLLRVKIDPNALADFFGVLQKREGDWSAAIQWLGTHPDLGERVRAVHAERERLAATSRTRSEPIALDWAAVRAHAGHAE
ncbi:MAG: M48 family metallopeptidase [Polyangiales bacterium]